MNLMNAANNARRVIWTAASPPAGFVGLARNQEFPSIAHFANHLLDNHHPSGTQESSYITQLKNQLNEDRSEENAYYMLGGEIGSLLGSRGYQIQGSTEGLEGHRQQRLAQEQDGLTVLGANNSRVLFAGKQRLECDRVAITGNDEYILHNPRIVGATDDAVSLDSEARENDRYTLRIAGDYVHTLRMALGKAAASGEGVAISRGTYKGMRRIGPSVRTPSKFKRMLNFLRLNRCFQEVAHI